MNLLEEARKILESKWEAEGQCGSCNHHAALWEHDIDDEDIREALRGDGELRLHCINGDFDDACDHRGIHINIKPTRPLDHDCDPTCTECT